MTIAIVQFEDWEGVYLDGKMFDQNHSIDYTNLLENLIGQKISNVIIYNIEDEEWIENNGRLPNEFSDIPEDILLR